MVRSTLTLALAGCWLGLLLVSAVPAADKAKAAPKDEVVDKDDVQKAVDLGVKYLKESQRKDGAWGPEANKGGFRGMGYETGITALAGLALLEADVPAKDPVIEKAAGFLRDAVPDMTFTHSVGATVLFLDRLGDPKDVPAIKTLCVRLMAAQSADGGWGYTCPKIAAETVAKWTKPEDYKNGIPKAIKELEAAEKRAGPGVGGLGAPKLMAGQGLFIGGITENSCSEFAVQGLWIGRRHEVPVLASLGKFETYVRKNQNADGSFPYSTHHNNGGLVFAGNGPSGTPCMTCAGLLGLIYSNGAANESALLKYAKSKNPPKLAPGKGLRDNTTDAAMKKGLAALEVTIKLSELPPPKAGGAGGLGGVGGFGMMGHPNPWTEEAPWAYMAFWSVERVGVAYGKEKIGKIDWYNWGARLLLKYQKKDGSWGKEGFGGMMGPDLNSAFALLFLRRAELAPDLPMLSKGVLPPAPVVSPMGDQGDKPKDK